MAAANKISEAGAAAADLAETGGILTLEEAERNETEGFSLWATLLWFWRAFRSTARCVAASRGANVSPRTNRKPKLAVKHVTDVGICPSKRISCENCRHYINFVS